MDSSFCFLFLKQNIQNVFSNSQHQEVQYRVASVHHTLTRHNREQGSGDTSSGTASTSQCEQTLPLCSPTVPGGKAQLGKTKKCFWILKSDGSTQRPTFDILDLHFHTEGERLLHEEIRVIPSSSLNC